MGHRKEMRKINHIYDIVSTMITTCTRYTINILDSTIQERKAQFHNLQCLDVKRKKCTAERVNRCVSIMLRIRPLKPEYISRFPRRLTASPSYQVQRHLSSHFCAWATPLDKETNGKQDWPLDGWSLIS